MILKNIYIKLFESYGPQHWWPVTDKGKSKPDYKPRKKLSEKQQLEICIGAILTQNTAWKNVEKAIEALNRANLIDAKKIATIDEKKLAALIRPSGYYNQKARKLKEFARFVVEKGGLKGLFMLGAEELRKELLSVNGIGPETADSIILYAAKKPVFVIDAYTKRIFSRLGMCRQDAKYDELQQLFHNSLKKDAEMFSEYHALLVEQGKNFCRKKPVCNSCVILSLCAKRLK